MNGHDFTREQNMEARIRLAAARRELADAVNDATTGIGCLTCDDPQTMNHIRACWKRIYDRYLETDSLIADLAACARNITDGGEWKPSELATESKPIDMAEGCACFTAETPDRVLITPSEPTPGENTAKRLANTLNALTGDVLLDATGIRLLGTRFLFAYHGRLDRPVDYGVNLTSMRFPDRLGLLDRAERYPGFLPLRPRRRQRDRRIGTGGTRTVGDNRAYARPAAAQTVLRGFDHVRGPAEDTRTVRRPLREIPERRQDRPGRDHHRSDRPRRPPRRHHQTEMGLSNGVILLIRQPSGVENSVRKQCATLDEAETWLDKQIGEDD